MISKLFVANRGEIAVRIIRSAHAMGIATVQGISEADREMLAAKLAGETVVLGPAKASKSYLDCSAVIRAAIETNCDAIHPGYGFLSENAEFADLVEQADIVFIGPQPETIRQMGDKAEARRTARAAGVATVPGSIGCLQNLEEGSEFAKEIGFPLMIKAAAGGGGRGIRIARNSEELPGLLREAAAEAKAAFGDGNLYLERFVERARHIEVQILGDGKNVIHLFDRECSIQRRRQKIWEEAPASALPLATRTTLCESAVHLAKTVGYRGAGTIEYLYDQHTGDFFFIEMNTRIQVEHPVTEMITGIDLIRETLRVASTGVLKLRQEDVMSRGHAIEVRINAEDPSRDFLPSPGTITGLRLPAGPWVRFDGTIYEGYRVPPFYDSLLGKLIVWDQTRDGALARLSQALAELKVGGIATTASLHAALARSPEVKALSVHTRWLEAWLETSR